jgi:hypothetical protein
MDKSISYVRLEGQGGFENVANRDRLLGTNHETWGKYGGVFGAKRQKHPHQTSFSRQFPESPMIFQSLIPFIGL